MATLAYSEILPKTVITLDGEPFEVLSSHIFRMQMRKPVNQTKLRNLRSGKVTERSFHQAETVKEADMEYENITFLYHNRGEYWFCEEGKPGNRFQLADELIGDRGHYLKQNGPVEAMKFEGEVIGIKLPIKMELKVKEAPPAVKGNTVQGGTKIVTLETGATVDAPMFINEGDTIRINTDTGEYVERVSKS
jgi:elongation factor P